MRLSACAWPAMQTMNVRLPIDNQLTSLPESSRLDFASIEAPRLTHYLFRFPAKFHPPVAHSLIRSYTAPGQTVLDPFCGSGTLLVSAAAEGRGAIGSDVDPVAVFVSQVKTHRFSPAQLHASWAILRPLITTDARSTDEYEMRRFEDIAEGKYEDILSSEHLWIPYLPNLQHWFRRYVIIDLARILHRITHSAIPETHRRFFLLILASIIRKSSNADPVPVSGLEVTSYMKKLDAAGRLVNPFQLFTRATEKGLIAVKSYNDTCPPQGMSVLRADATSLNSRLRKQVDAVITSPPYHNAVDYYRRHQLEMYWLGFTKTRADRLELLPRYIGRSSVGSQDPLLRQIAKLGPLSRQLHEQITISSKKRADSFAHYMLSMGKAFAQLAMIVRANAPVIFVLGHSDLNGSKIPTSDLFIEMAGGDFSLEDKLWYPIKNRYMSYGRHNGASIDEEHVLVFRRRES